MCRWRWWVDAKMGHYLFVYLVQLDAIAILFRFIYLIPGSECDATRRKSVCVCERSAGTRMTTRRVKLTAIIVK